MAETPEAYDGLRAFADAQRAAGVTVEPVPADRLRDVEPRLAPGLPGGVRYPQDAQVMPALAAAHLLRASRARLLTGHEVTRVLRARDGTVRGVRTPAATSTPPRSSTRPVPGAANSPRAPMCSCRSCQRACVVPARPGDVIRTQEGTGHED
ncbi:hypothetical protein STREPTOSP366_57430 [Streptomyces variabilis]